MIRVAICENEGEELIRLKELIEGSSESVTITVYASGEPLLWDIRTGRVYFDVYFVGNQIHELEGAEIVEHIRMVDEDAIIIFLSDSGEIEKEGQQLMVFGVLVRPIGRTLFERMFERALDQVKQAHEQVFHITTHTHTYTVRYSHICYIANENRRITIHLRGDDIRQYSGRFSDFITLLSNDHFARCHQKYIVNLSRVTQLTPESFWLGDIEIPISKKYSKSARERYNKHLFSVFEQY